MTVDKYEMQKWEGVQRLIQKSDAEKSKGLLGGVSGLGTYRPDPDLEAKLAEAVKITSKDYLIKTGKLPEFKKGKSYTGTFTPAVVEDLYAKYSHYRQFRGGIKHLDKAIADFIVQNDIDANNLRLDVTVNAEYKHAYLQTLVTTTYQLDYLPTGRLGIVQSHVMSYTVLIDEDHK